MMLKCQLAFSLRVGFSWWLKSQFRSLTVSREIKLTTVARRNKCENNFFFPLKEQLIQKLPKPNLIDKSEKRESKTEMNARKNGWQIVQ